MRILKVELYFMKIKNLLKYNKCIYYCIVFYIFFGIEDMQIWYYIFKLYFNYILI